MPTSLGSVGEMQLGYAWLTCARSASTGVAGRRARWIAAPENWLGISESLKSVRSERAAQIELGEESSQGPAAELRRRASVLDQAIRIRGVRAQGFCRLSLVL